MTQPHVSPRDPRSDDSTGAQDTAGWGLLGLTLGVLIGFFGSFYGLIPLFPRGGDVLMLTIMTAIVTAAMTIGGAVGYLATRRRTRAGER
jgi:hypothetical protein